MFTLAVLIGIYSYIIFAIGLSGLLYKQIVFIISALFILNNLYLLKKNINLILKKMLSVLRHIKRDRLITIFILIIVLQALVNLIGTLGPELGFDALWYHLTLPKIYLTNHSIAFIPGGLFYYSAMPKLTEMIYLAGLAFGNEIFAKLIHFSFGILSLIALYNLSRKFFTSRFSLLTLLVFYTNLVVGWLSTSSYIDLSRTFFEIMALLGYINWCEKKKKRWLILSAIMLGLAISTKLLALGSLLIFTFLMIFGSLWKPMFKLGSLITNILVYWWFALLIPLPWIVFSYINTGNPLYPFFTSIYPVNLSIELVNPIKFIYDIWSIFIKSADPISPIYIIFLPIVLFLHKKVPDKLKIVYIYSFMAILVWYITPRTGGGRFILPYLPAFTILSVWVIREIWNLKIRAIVLGFVIFFSLFSIVYRLRANLKYIPVILGYQSKLDFLTKNLNFSFGDFYDTDGYFARKIKKGDKVLLYGFHNLYYIDFPFIDSSYVKKGDEFNYIAVQNSQIPKRFSYWSQVYYNPVTNVSLYSAGHSTLRDEFLGSDSKRGQKWFY